MSSLLKTPFFPEPSFNHGQAERTAVLYCNLGTPSSPNTKDVRRFLGEFLNDHRVVEIPRLIWLLILHFIILRFRPAKSAAKYSSIWTPAGSPLQVHTSEQARSLEAFLKHKGHHLIVRYAMRYGDHSIEDELKNLKQEGISRILILPAYPQYSATTTASLFDSVYGWAKKTRLIPELRFVNHYHDNLSYIKALANSIKKHWEINGHPEQLVMSFHGVPERTLHLGDPYHCECLKTARLLSEELNLKKNQYRVTFQSRLGRAKWLEPYTEPSLIKMAKEGIKKVDLICPGFTSDCLETLEEIDIEARAAYLGAGGQSFNYITCLNNSDDFIKALGEITEQHLLGWPTYQVPNLEKLAISRDTAISLGASQ